MMDPHTASNSATLAMTASLAAQVEGPASATPCSARLRLHLHSRERNRRAELAPDAVTDEASACAMRDLVISGVSPNPVSERAAEAVAAGGLNIFTHPDRRAFVEARFARIMTAFDTAERSSGLAGLAPPRFA